MSTAIIKVSLALIIALTPNDPVMGAKLSRTCAQTMIVEVDGLKRRAGSPVSRV
jgi:hypothetical protein